MLCKEERSALPPRWRNSHTRDTTHARASEPAHERASFWRRIQRLPTGEPLVEMCQRRTTASCEGGTGTERMPPKAFSRPRRIGTVPDAIALLLGTPHKDPFGLSVMKLQRSRLRAVVCFDLTKHLNICE